MKITMDSKYVSSLEKSSIEKWQSRVFKARQSLFGPQGDQLKNHGFAILPDRVKASELVREIHMVADDLRAQSDTVVVVGVGGSYAGAKAVLEASKPYFATAEVEVVFAGHHLSSTYLSELRQYLKGKRYSIIVISKSGTTVEPAIAFDILRNDLMQSISKDAIKKRIVAITDSTSGTLRALADKEGYRTFEVPDDVGGRYSVFSAVGLLPLAVAGVDITALIEGACDASKAFTQEKPFLADQYASLRLALQEQGKRTEILAYYEPSMQAFAEWFKQLFNESEGKDGKGIFVTSAAYTTDLHSIGQYVQEGPRDLFETIITLNTVNEDLPSGIFKHHSVDGVNKAAQRGVFEAHSAGGCPVIGIVLPSTALKNLGALMQTMMFACALSATAQGINPFNQPGVEAYKKQMQHHLNQT